MQTMKHFFALALWVIISLCRGQSVNVVPLPQEVILGNGVFNLAPSSSDNKDHYLREPVEPNGSFKYKSIY
jgi:hypothetical protein